MENQLISLIKQFNAEFNKIPTLVEFSQFYKISQSKIIKNFGSWNNLLFEGGLKCNKSSKRSDEQLLLWIKTHPSIKYNDIPIGIRSSIEKRFGSITEARVLAGLSITDWRSLSKKKSYKTNGGRPTEYSKELIISGLQALASSLGKPPRLKDVNKKACGFPKTAIISRFKSFNQALIAANLPPVYSHFEFIKLQNDLESLMINIKLFLNDYPTFYNIEINGLKPKFVYPNRWEDIKLTRNDILSSITILSQFKNHANNITVYYLVDDSLYENDNINMVCIMNFLSIDNDYIKSKIMELRTKYDEINRKYVGQKIYE